MKNGGKNKSVAFIILFSIPETFNGLDLLDVRAPFPPPQIESDCDSDGSDGESQGETAHLPSRLLNGNAEVNYLEDWADVHENQLVCAPHMTTNNPFYNVRPIFSALNE